MKKPTDKKSTKRGGEGWNNASREPLIDRTVYPVASNTFVERVPKPPQQPQARPQPQWEPDWSQAPPAPTVQDPNFIRTTLIDTDAIDDDILYRRGGKGSDNKKTCTKQTTKKYTTRPSPPYPANQCPEGSVRKGNDGKMYRSVAASNGVRRWTPVVKSKSKK